MDDRQRRDQEDRPLHDRDASQISDKDRHDGVTRRDQERQRPALTRREREERWPIG